jgi:hypothetical protein
MPYQQIALSSTAFFIKKKKCYEFSFFLESPYRIANSRDPHRIVALLKCNALPLSEGEFGENIPPPEAYCVGRSVQQPILPSGSVTLHFNCDVTVA